MAEDDEFSEILIRELLNNFAREMITVKSGSEAVDFCRNNPDTNLVLMDIRMPRMNGYEATKQIRLFNSKVIIVAQTAMTYNEEWEKAVDAGCNDLISKPFTKAVFEKLLEKHFKLVQI
ncbi:response regulator [Maribellus comscasis]|uniref:response regulator n=1 Tax=Maribellus comscasis TaxID=2681766 RepID=UPI0024833244|nr:response regulator [Maribellus comscasis]